MSGMSMQRTDLPDGSALLTMPYDEGLARKAVVGDIEDRTETPDPSSGDSSGSRRDDSGPITRFNDFFTDIGSTYLEALGMDGFEIAKAIQTRRNELFRNKFPLLLPRFVTKCTECGAEYDERPEECDNCGASEELLRDPDRSEKLDAERLFERVNKEGQSLSALLGSCEDTHGQLGVATFVIKYEYVMATGDVTALGQPVMERGQVIRKEPDELIEADPKRVVPVTDENGRLGGWRWTCPVHREAASVNREEYKSGANRCPECGTELREVCFVEKSHVRSGSVEKYYFQDEVVSWAHFFPRLHGLDGLSPVHHVWMKQAILHWMDVYAGAYYDPESDKYPNKFMVVHTTNAEAWERNFRQSQDEAEENLYANKILVNEYAADSQSTPEMQVMDLMDDELLGQDQEIKKQYKSDIRTQFGVTDVFDSELEDAGGLNNEGLQLEVTDRSIASAQQKMQDGPLDELMRSLGFDDWRIAFVPESDRDLEALEKKVGIGEDAAGAGLEARLENGELEVEDGEFEAGDDEGMGGLFSADPESDAEASDDDPMDEVHEAADYLRDGLEHIAWADETIKAEPFWDDSSDVPERVREAVVDAIEDGAVFETIEDVDTDRISELKDVLADLLSESGNWSLDSISEAISDALGVGPERADSIARTESASVLNNAREDVFEDLEDDKDEELLYEWIGPSDHRTTDACAWLEEQTAGGVTMDELVDLQREAQNKFFPQLDEFRRHVVHPNERHTFSEAFSTKSIPGATGDIEVEVETVPGGLEVVA